ncbi:MAG: ATP-binding protein, partial [Planctomycetota bacterium]|nr:ATP-binding protein [Planctomycetota bacterium]
GTRLVLASRLSNVVDADGAVVGSVEILDDRTEMTALAERVHAMDKMAALGTMGTGIAHELRNPLNAVKGFAQLLLRELPKSGNSEARLAKSILWAKRIDEGASEADAIITSLLSFVRPERVDLSAIDGEELLAGAVAAALPPPNGQGGQGGQEGREEPERWRVETRCDAPPFRGDRIKLRHALRNLVANAIQAQPDGGEIEIDLVRRGEEIIATVRDGGPGIPANERGRVLDPFFTTRAEGTGLGLALAATIARLHGGDVEVAPRASSLGGAEISLRIPYQPADGPAARTP